ncbi:hypothetical protein [Saccharothrix sp. ALI-22-I]|uniref:hypothetical protein n=1 Tax=Saccharothrix sp. ALI-22-I TaxID=1933778 RepID=UPI0015C3FB21|nr:hypothetical protein [Saccharothrix sp. ALI-22-I]
MATVPTGKRWVLTNLIITHSGSINAASVYVWVSLNGTPLVAWYVLAPGSVFTLDCAQVLESGNQLQAWSDSVGLVAINASGVEMDL